MPSRLRRLGLVPVMAAALALVAAPAAGAQNPLGVALDHVDRNARDLGVARADVVDLAVTSRYRSPHSGVTHVNLSQRLSVAGCVATLCQMSTSSNAGGDTEGMDPRGAYPADRAAALSGVPKSTVHYWARTGVLVPSLSEVRVKLWSYRDLMALRTIAWLRASKKAPDGHEIPATAMRAVRNALRELAGLNLDLWSEEGGPNVAVDRAGRIVIDVSATPHQPNGQHLLDASVLELLRPFEISLSVRGPDLVAPRPRLRIVPGKLAGAPHVHRTRIETEALAALARRGLDRGQIVELYPAIEDADVADALDLERQLQPDLALVA